MKERANEIDLLRFTAALAVVFFHYGHLGSSISRAQQVSSTLAAASRYGYLGVDLFFLISGFVVMMSARDSTVSNFFASRAARLLPAFWACCSISFAFLALTGASTPTMHDYLANMPLFTVIASIRLIDSSYWSLGVELIFYGWVAILIWAKKLRHAEVVMPVWLAVSAVMLVHSVPVVRVILDVDYTAYFVAGGTLYFIWAEGLTKRRTLVLLAALGLAEYRAIGVARTLEMRDGVSFSPFVVSLIVAASFGVLLAVAMRKTGSLARRNWMQAGALTYPLYLLHQAVGMTLFRLADGNAHPKIVFWGVVALMLVLAWFVNVQIEMRFASRMRTLILRLITSPTRRAVAR